MSKLTYVNFSYKFFQKFNSHDFFQLIFCIYFIVATCYNTSTNQDCSNADNYCYDNYFSLFAKNLNCNIDDIRTSYDSSLPEDYINFLSKPEVMSAIGAKTQYIECNPNAYIAFTDTADL